jgi:hypothetical protein
MGTPFPLSMPLLALRPIQCHRIGDTLAPATTAIFRLLSATSTTGRAVIFMPSQFFSRILGVAVLFVGSQLGAAEVIAVPSPGGQPIAAKMDARGVLHLVCDAPGGPRYYRSEDGGRHFSRPLAVVELGQAHGVKGLEYTVWDLAVAPDGQVHVAIGTNAWKLKLPKEQWGFHYARLSPQATAFEPLRNINRKPSEGFSLAVDGKGNVAACWLADKLYANLSQDGGATFGPTREIDPSFNPCNCCTTSTAYGADGTLAILYREETNNDRDMFVVRWNTRTGKVARQPVSSTTWKIDACPMTYYSIVARGDGYLAAWPTRGRVYFARLDAAGRRQAPLEVATGGASGMRTGLRAVANSQGAMLLVWNNDNKLGWQRYAADCRPEGAEGHVATSGKGAATVVDSAGNFIVVH